MPTNKNRSRTKRIIIDIAAIGLIIISPLAGLIPGPGGLPVFFLGLGLLATNHDSIKRFMFYLEKHRLKATKKLFANPTVSLAVDVAGLIIIGGAIFMIFDTTALWLRAVAIGLITTTILILLNNRNRIERIISRFKK
jgi:hypothetical protein